MNRPKHILAEKFYELGKSVLALSALGILTKLLNIDLSNLEILGITFDPKSSRLIPGLIGITLLYVFAALVVSRAEAADYVIGDPEQIERLTNPTDVDKVRSLVSSFLLPFSIVTYFGPLIFGLLAIVVLWGDIVSVFAGLWSSL